MFKNLRLDADKTDDAAEMAAAMDYVETEAELLSVTQMRSSLERFLSIGSKMGFSRSLLAMVNEDDGLTAVARSVPSTESLLDVAEPTIDSAAIAADTEKVISDLQTAEEGLKDTLATHAGWVGLLTWIAGVSAGIPFVALASIPTWLILRHIRNKNGIVTAPNWSDVSDLISATDPATLDGITEIARMALPKNEEEFSRLLKAVKDHAAKAKDLGITFEDDPEKPRVRVDSVRFFTLASAGPLSEKGYSDRSLQQIANTIGDAEKAARSRLNGLKKANSDRAVELDRIEKGDDAEAKKFAKKGAALINNYCSVTTSAFVNVIKVLSKTASAISRHYVGDRVGTKLASPD